MFMNKLRISVMLKRRYLTSMLKKRGMTFKTERVIRIKSRVIHESELLLLRDGKVQIPDHEEVIEIEIYMNREGR